VAYERKKRKRTKNEKEKDWSILLLFVDMDKRLTDVRRPCCVHSSSCSNKRYFFFSLSLFDNQQYSMVPGSVGRKKERKKEEKKNLGLIGRINILIKRHTRTRTHTYRMVLILTNIYHRQSGFATIENIITYSYFNISSSKSEFGYWSFKYSL
jgi:hypothetical protein